MITDREPDRGEIPAPVLNDHGVMVPGMLVCGRRKAADGEPCTQNRSRYCPACWHHVTPEEKHAADVVWAARIYAERERKWREGGLDLHSAAVRRELRAAIEDRRDLRAAIEAEYQRPRRRRNTKV